MMKNFYLVASNPAIISIFYASSNRQRFACNQPRMWQAGLRFKKNIHNISTILLLNLALTPTVLPGNPSTRCLASPSSWR